MYLPLAITLLGLGLLRDPARSQSQERISSFDSSAPRVEGCGAFKVILSHWFNSKLKGEGVLGWAGRLSLITGLLILPSTDTMRNLRS